MGSEITDSEQLPGEGAGARASSNSPTGASGAPDPNPSGPLQLLEIKLSQVQSRWQTVIEQLSEKDGNINDLKGALEARAATIEQLESALDDALRAKTAAEDADALSKTELAHLESQLAEQAGLLKGYEERLRGVATQSQTPQQPFRDERGLINHPDADVQDGRAGRVHNASESQATPRPPLVLTSQRAVEHALDNLERYLGGGDAGGSSHDERLTDLAAAMGDLGQRGQQEPGLIDSQATAEADSELTVGEHASDARLVDHERTIALLQRQLQLRHGQLKQARAEAAEFAGTLMDLDQTIAVQAEQLDDFRSQLGERDVVLAEQQEKLRVADAQLADKTILNNELQGQLENVCEQLSRAEADAAGRRAAVSALEKRLLSESETLAAANATLQRASDEVEQLQQELSATRELKIQLEQAVVGFHLDQEIFQSELAAQQALVRQLAEALENQRRSMVLLNESTGRMNVHVQRWVGADPQPGESDSRVATEPRVSDSADPYLTQDGVRWVLNKPVVTIGRSRKADITLESPFASRFHARLIKRSNGQVLIEDLGSQNGLQVNGKVINRAVLCEDDLIRVGEDELRFAQPSATSS